MPLTFKSKSYANVTMLSAVGMKMLELMNFGTRVPGGIVADDIFTALHNLQQELRGFPKEIAIDHDSAEDDKPRISLHTRAIPLIELLQAADADNNDIRWE